MNLHHVTENLYFFLVVYLFLTLDNPLDNHLVPKASTQKLTYINNNK